MKKNFFQLFIVTFAVFLFASLSHAQIPLQGASAVRVSPQYPGANEIVTVSIEDYSTDLNTKTITWSVNGAQQQSGIGLTSYSFTTGSLGTVSRVSISAGGNIYETTIRPTEVDMIWEATDSYVPPFYEGKALLPNQGTVVVSAVPHFFSSTDTRIDPKQLVYKWKKDGSVVQDQSGYGKSSIRIKNSLLIKPSQYEVEVSSPDGTLKGRGTVRIEEVQPQIALFENDPLYGIQFGTNLNNKNFSLDSDEIEITAFPFFFTTNINSDALNYTWRMNGGTVQNNSRNIVFRKTGGEQGQSRIEISARHSENFMQRADSKTTAVFSNE